MPLIFMDLVDKSAFYICVFSRNKFIWQDAVYSTKYFFFRFKAKFSVSGYFCKIFYYFSFQNKLKSFPDDFPKPMKYFRLSIIKRKALSDFPKIIGKIPGKLSVIVWLFLTSWRFSKPFALYMIIDQDHSNSMELVAFFYSQKLNFKIDFCFFFHEWNEYKTCKWLEIRSKVGLPYYL